MAVSNRMHGAHSSSSSRAAAARLGVHATRRPLVWAWCAVLSLAAFGSASAQPPAHSEVVTVARVAIDAHVLRDDGSPVAGLGPSNFKVRVDGREVKVLTAEWTTGAVADRARDRAVAAGRDSAGERAPLPSGLLGLPRGRQVVLLIQKDFEQTRMEGLVSLLRRARTFVGGLQAEDRVAVLSFDSHLALWSDFTEDRVAIDRLLEQRLLMGAPPRSVPAAAPPSLARSFDRGAANRAASMEQALLVLSQALAQVPGAKALVILGHGFGRLGLPGVTGLPNTMSFDREYGEARRVFMAGRTTVYCLDTTRADYHSLEAGLQQVAADTGGFFLRTHEFPDAAMRRLGDALSGRYELSIEKPPLPAGEHRITVELVGAKGLVLARRSYVG